MSIAAIEGERNNGHGKVSIISECINGKRNTYAELIENCLWSECGVERTDFFRSMRSQLFVTHFVFLNYDLRPSHIFLHYLPNVFGALLEKKKINSILQMQNKTKLIESIRLNDRTNMKFNEQKTHGSPIEAVLLTFQFVKWFHRSNRTDS